jgi:hypothetical protein
MPPKAMRSLVPFFDSQAYGGGTLTRLHVGPGRLAVETNVEMKSSPLTFLNCRWESKELMIFRVSSFCNVPKQEVDIS